MPYISFENRVALEHGDTPQNAGELNYLFTCIANDYLADKGLSYQRLNDIVGAMECAKDELYRRIAAPYEDKKIAENGDVYYGIEQQAAKASPPPELRREGVEL